MGLGSFSLVLWAVGGWQHPATSELLRLGLGPAAALLGEKMLEDWRGRPMLAALPRSAVCSNSVCVADLDLLTVPYEDGLNEIVSRRTVELTVDAVRLSVTIPQIDQGLSLKVSW